MLQFRSNTQCMYWASLLCQQEYVLHTLRIIRFLKNVLLTIDHICSAQIITEAVIMSHNSDIDYLMQGVT